MSDDWLGQMFWEMAHKYGVSIYPRKVARSSLSFILPKAFKRAILRARDYAYLRPFMKLDVSTYEALHLDGHQADAALYYAKVFRERGLLTSLDGGAIRANTEEVLHHIDVAVVPEDFCAQLNLTSLETLGYLASRGVKIAAVTEGERGLLWSDENGSISAHAGAVRAFRQGHRHVRRRRRLPRRLSCVLPAQPHRALGRPFRFRPRGLRLQGPASRQRIRPAHAR